MLQLRSVTPDYWLIALMFVRLEIKKQAKQDYYR